jgi:hypothetical protein
MAMDMDYDINDDNINCNNFITLNDWIFDFDEHNYKLIGIHVYIRSMKKKLGYFLCIY